MHILAFPRRCLFLVTFLLSIVCGLSGLVNAQGKANHPNVILTGSARPIVESVPPTAEDILQRAGAKRVEDNGTQFELGRGNISLHYAQDTLGAIKVEFKHPGSKAEYARIVHLADTMKSMGSQQTFGNFGSVSPAGSVTKKLEYSRAYIIRTEQTCSLRQKSNCGIRRFTIYYWLPLPGTITGKRSDEADVTSLRFNQRQYFVTVGEETFEISEQDFKSLDLNQAVKLERIAWTNKARIAAVKPVENASSNSEEKTSRQAEAPVANNSVEKAVEDVKQTEWLFNLPTAPVLITLAERKNYLFFNNISGKEITEMRLGIVKSVNNKYRILSRNSSVKLNGNLPNGHVQFAGIADYLVDINMAAKKKARLTVISVKFHDGSIWRIPS